MVSYDTLGNRCTDSIDLSSHTTSLHANTNIQVTEFILSNDEYRLEDLKAEHLRLDVLNRLSIDLDQAAALFGESNCSSSLFPIKL